MAGKAKKFGTFGGVFTPSILTILGVIMYMRLPMIAGEAGLIGTLGIVLIAHLISITTGLSVSSIATDKKVKEGGTYYIISRSLGLPIGGTLGLALFVGLSFSVSLYLIGFSESFLGYWGLPMDINHIRITGTIILLLVTIITFISTSLAIKAQYLIMAAIGLSLLSIFLGRHDFTPETPNFFGSGTGIPFMVLFGIFFPAVTGFEAGVSMSGDLRDPKKSIPVGTISAIAIGLAAYIGLAFFFAYTVDKDLLASDPRALFKISLVPQLVIAGIWGATLSSALGSILAAPRILQSTALDRITPRFFARGTGAAKEPRNALLLTFLIAEAGILIGELDVIARIVSIFFITTYGFLNLSAAFESMTSADFRPSFKTPYWVSLVGSLACILVMVQLDFLAMIGAVVILGALFLFLKSRQLVLESGDAWSSVWFSMARTSLRKLNKSELNTRNWRPNIILFSGRDNDRPHLVEFARAFSGKFGIFSAFELVETKVKDLIKDQRYFASSGSRDELLIHSHKCLDIYDGMDEITRVYGFSGIEPNTVLMGWSQNEKNKGKFLDLVRKLHKSDFNTVYLNYNHQKKFGSKKTIDIWWSGQGNNLAFSIFLMRHFTAGGDWKDARIRLLVINNSKSPADSAYNKLSEILNHYRISMDISIIDNHYEKLTKTEIICRESASADLTFIDIPIRQYQHIESLYDEEQVLAKDLGTFLLINGFSKFETFNLQLEEKAEDKTTQSLPVNFELPPLIPSKYPVINEEIIKADLNGQQVLESFNEKFIIPVFSEMKNLADEYRTAINLVKAQLGKLEDKDDTYRRKKSIIKIKNDFYFRVDRILAGFISEKLANQKQAMGNGIQWYAKTLEEDLLHLPDKCVIRYDKQDLALKRNDPVRLKWFKLRRRITHPFARKSIPGKIKYYDIAAYYLRDNRHQFLSSFLIKLELDLLSILADYRVMNSTAENVLENLLQNTGKKEPFNSEIRNSRNELEEMIRNIEANIHNVQQTVFHHILLEFRKNLQLMSNDMGKADINFRIRRKRRKRKYYRHLIDTNSGFAENWQEQALSQVNRIKMDVLLQSYQSRIKDKTLELFLGLTLQLEKGYAAELNTIRKKLGNFDQINYEIPGLSLTHQNLNEKLTFLEDFDNFGEDILKLTETLPEHITIALSDADKPDDKALHRLLDVPLRKITRFYIEARFLGVTHDQLEKEAKALRQSIFSVHDLLSLVRFSIVNVPDDMPDRDQQLASIIRPACEMISVEEEKALASMESIFVTINRNCQEVFSQLYAFRIPDTLNEYSSIIREGQSMQVRKAFNRNIEEFRKAYKQLVARLLYSRSEGILLAKKILEQELPVSKNEKLLCFVESIKPKTGVMDKLPQYYRNLFSGKSTISEDFWIARKQDETIFKTAVQRWRSGYYGGIIIIGDRNTGKTAFCLNLEQTLLKKYKVYQLFPPDHGSVHIEDFLGELTKITQTRGNLEDIMERLPHGSIFIIHDLELWWERSSHGWDVIMLLIQMINQYSRKFLFVANVNPFAFGLMNKIAGLRNVFISEIYLRPFDALELRNMILRRHHSGGLKFVLNKREEDTLTEIGIARLFNKYFSLTGGNPGMTLNAWLANIVKIERGKIYIKFPALPNASILSSIDEDRKLVLIGLILAKRLTFEKIQNILQMDGAGTTRVINSMMRTGLVVERSEGLYMVNEALVPYVISEFKREGLLPDDAEN